MVTLVCLQYKGRAGGRERVRYTKCYDVSTCVCVHACVCMHVCVCVCMCACVHVCVHVFMCVLLYGSETWTTKWAVATKLEAFHSTTDV